MCCVRPASEWTCSNSWGGDLLARCRQWAPGRQWPPKRSERPLWWTSRHAWNDLVPCCLQQAKQGCWPPPGTDFVCLNQLWMQTWAIIWLMCWLQMSADQSWTCHVCSVNMLRTLALYCYMLASSWVAIVSIQQIVSFTKCILELECEAENAFKTGINIKPLGQCFVVNCVHTRDMTYH